MLCMLPAQVFLINLHHAIDCTLIGNQIMSLKVVNSPPLDLQDLPKDPALVVGKEYLFDQEKEKASAPPSLTIVPKAD